MTDPARSSPMPLGLARALVFSSSAAVLVLEILAGRLMAPYVGVSLETFTGIIGVVLAGIALGTAVGGRLADRFDPASLLGPAYALGGALSWWSLWVVFTLGPDVGRGPVAIVALSTLGFFAPAAVLSAVSPLVTKLRLRHLDETGTVVGSLSAWGTAGALFGVFVTGFVLVAAWPTKPIVLVLGAVLVVTGAALTGWHTRRPPSIAVILVVLVSFGVGASGSSPCGFESAYFCGRVVTDADDPDVRLLVLDDLVHAAVDLADPDDLQLRYVRLLAAAVDDRPAGPLDVVHVGGGGFTLPGHVARTRPGSANTVFEIDDVLLDVARDELGYVPDRGTEVVVGDARLLMTDLADASQDVVVGDAFGGAAVPWHLTTSEFLDEVARVLRPDGVYLLNLIDGGANDFAEWQARTLLDRFAHVELIAPVDGVAEVANQVFVASNGPIDRFEVDPDGVWVDDVVGFASSGRVLTDDYAPVDQLLTTR
ncbi:MAG: fused MFS/spermidine synthase [Actinomycetota bacterium]